MISSVSHLSGEVPDMATFGINNTLIFLKPPFTPFLWPWSQDTSAKLCHRSARSDKRPAASHFYLEPSYPFCSCLFGEPNAEASNSKVFTREQCSSLRQPTNTRDRVRWRASASSSCSSPSYNSIRRNSDKPPPSIIIRRQVAWGKTRVTLNPDSGL
jgi:hypothetical protein